MELFAQPLLENRTGAYIEGLDNKFVTCLASIAMAGP